MTDRWPHFMRIEHPDIEHGMEPLPDTLPLTSDGGALEFRDLAAGRAARNLRSTSLGAYRGVGMVAVALLQYLVGGILVPKI